MQRVPTDPEAPASEAPQSDGLSRVSRRYRQTATQSILHGDFGGARSSADALVSHNTLGYCRWKKPQEYEAKIHDVWYVYYEAAKNIPHESPELDRFVLDILRIRGRSPLMVKKKGGDGFQRGTTLAGEVLWEDLPYFATDMVAYWVSDCANMSFAQRLNFTHFVARLASTGISNDRLCRIALLVLTETFETSRPLGSLSDAPGLNLRGSDGTTAQLTVAALLAAANAWLLHAGYKIIQLSHASWNDCPGTTGQPGPAFAASELGGNATSGFSSRRWTYWLKRLEEIKKEADEKDELHLFSMAQRTIDQMLSHVEFWESSVLDELEAAGQLTEDQYRFSHRKRFSKLDE